MIRLRSLPLKLRRFGIPVQLVSLFLCLSCLPALHAQATFTVVGPDGGDARAFASVPGQPNHLYLGTTNSWLYESLDEGATWHRLAKLDRSDGFVLDNIVVDSANPSTLYVGAWKDTDDGGLWISHDAGHTWHEVAFFKGQPVQALAQAPSDPHILFAGTLQGVYRSSDSGATWAQISPPGSHEIHEIESLAVDPADPDIVYAGTWHLPWKTTDGGKTWSNIKQGIIDDSDVFSIIVDPDHPHIVYLSACSGIYKSENAGALFHKIQGIPTDARRTRVLMQDPENLEVVYAGTTEGLYKTVNGGKTFERMTDSRRDRQRRLCRSARTPIACFWPPIAAESSSSDDAGVTFTASNRGISERKIAALLVDNRNPAATIHRVSMPAWSTTSNSAASSAPSMAARTGSSSAPGSMAATCLLWPKPKMAPSWPEPATASLFSVTLPPPQTLWRRPRPKMPPRKRPFRRIGAPSGDALTWQPRNAIANTLLKTSTETHHGTKVNIEKAVNAPVIQFESLVNALDVSGDVWVAATTYGLLTSHDQGATWQGGPVMGEGNYLSVTVHGDDMVAARDDSVVISKRCRPVLVAPWACPPCSRTFTASSFRPTAHSGWARAKASTSRATWAKPGCGFSRLPFRDVDDLSYDPASKRVLVSSRTSDEVYAIDPRTMTWVWWQTGYQIAFIRAAGDRLVAASLDDGVLLGPKVPPAPAPPPDAPAP